MENKTEDTRIKILLTGASGFVGQNIINELNKEKNPPLIYNLGRTKVVAENIINIPCDDITTFQFDTIKDEFDFIIHSLALSNDAYCKDFSYANSINVEFTKKLLDFSLKQSNLKKFVYISSIIIYSNNNPTPVRETAELYLHYSNYSFTKGIAEHYTNHYREKYNLPAIVFRLSNIYGPNQSYENSPFLVPSKIIQGLKEGKIEVFNLTPRRDWIYSGDAASLIVTSLSSPATGIFNLGSGKGISVEEIISEIAKELNVPYSSLNKPTSGPLDFYCDIQKTIETFSWRPETSLDVGIKQTISYIKKGLESGK